MKGKYLMLIGGITILFGFLPPVDNLSICCFVSGGVCFLLGLLEENRG